LRSKCPECGFDHDELRARIRGSLWDCVTIVCGFNSKNFKTPPSRRLHKRVLDWLQERIESPGKHKRLLLMLPRGHLKTSVVTVGLSTWLVLRDRNTRGFIMHKLPEEAKGFLAYVKKILRSELVLHLFPDVIPEQDPARIGLRWKDEEIEVLRDRYHHNATLETKGLRSTMEGTHPLWAIADDLVDREVSRSPVLTSRAIEFRRNIGQILEPDDGSFFLVVGTAWPGGFYEELMDDPVYEKLVLGCYQDERSARLGLTDYGEPIWPERYSKEDLEALRIEMTDYVFAHQYLNQFTSKTSGFDTGDFRYYDWDASTRELRFSLDGGKSFQTLSLADADAIVTTIDPATGAGDDETAIVTTAAFLKNHGLLAVLDVWHGRANPERQLEELYRMIKKWNPSRVAAERGLWAMLDPFWKRMCAERGIRVRVEEISHGLRAKTDRIWQLQPWVANHRLLIQRNMNVIVDQFARYSPTARKNQDDVIDCLAYALDVLDDIIRRYSPLRLPQIKISDGYTDDEDVSEEIEQARRRISGGSWRIVGRSKMRSGWRIM
jgi:hypothetical protein